MPEENKAIKTLTTINGVLEQSSLTLAAAFAAYRLLATIWMQNNPTKTFEEYNAYLRTEAQGLGDNALAWFAQHGWVEQPDGSFTPPATPPSV